MGQERSQQSFLKSAKFRVLIVIALVMIIVGLTVGYLGYQRSKAATEAVSGAAIGTTPANIQSIPGGAATTVQYARSVTQSNVEAAEEAAAKAGAAVPTLVRPTYEGPTDFGTGAADCSVDALRRARAAGVSALELRCKGCSIAALRAAGYSIGDMLGAGASAKSLRDAGYSCEQLVAAGYGVTEIKQAGYTERELKQCFPQGIATDSDMPKNCSISELKKAREKGVSVAAIRKKLGCSAAQFLAAGFTPGQLRAAGFTAKELADAGVGPELLRQAGASAKDLRDAGFSTGQLKSAGYTTGDLVRAGYSPDALAPHIAQTVFPKNCSPSELERAFKADISASVIRSKLGCTEAQMEAGGFAPKQQAALAFPKSCSTEELKQARAQGISASAIRKRLGCSAAQLKAADYTAAELAATGLTPDQLRAAGFAIGASVQQAFATLPSVQSDESTQFLEKLRKQQASELSSQQRQAQVQTISQSMVTQASQLLSSWAPPPKQKYTEGEKEKKQKVGKAGGVEGAAGGTTAAGGVPGAAPVAYTIKAGSVMFGVLDTSVNSDERSPVLATVVSGKLSGTKLVGQFSRVQKRVLISFNKASVPGIQKSIALSVVAIDPETARTALATSVNSHYLLRYGTLFASSFLSGMASAIQSSGSTTTNSGTGVVTTQNPSLNTTDKLLVALGNFGTQYASVLQSQFSTPPTVKVSEGTSIGLLFMNDLAVPKKGDAFGGDTP